MAGLAQLAGNEVRVLEFGNAYYKIVALADNIDQPVIEIDIETNISVGFGELQQS